MRRALFERLGFVRLIEAIDSEGDVAIPKRSGAPQIVQRVADAKALDTVLVELRALPMVPLFCVLGENAPMSGEVAGLAFGLAGDRAAYLGIGAEPGKLGMELVVDRLRPLLEGADAHGWSACDAKQIQVVFGELGLELPPPAFDLGIASQLLDPTGANSPSALSQRELGRKLASWEYLAGRGAKAKPIRELPADAIADWAGHQVCALGALYEILVERLERDGLSRLCETIELPLTGVLARMHRTGVRIDEALLEELQRVVSAREIRWCELPASSSVSPSSSRDGEADVAADQENQDRLFDRRRCARTTRIETRTASADPRPPAAREAEDTTGDFCRARESDSYHRRSHRRDVLSLQLESAVFDSQRGGSGFARPSFLGREVLPRPTSQVELRILAHFSQDQSLVDAFEAGDDIHRRTAAEVAGIDLEAVSDDQRARAKAVNFGAIYGVSA
jgi:DNA polymerase-1